MAVLNDHIKAFIVRSLACFDTPSQVIAAVKEEFGVNVTKQQVAGYNPENATGKDLSKKLREIFYETRDKFKKKADGIAIANQSYRLRVLDRMLRRAEERGNIAMAAAILEQASKEAGGVYTNRRELTGKDGKDLTPATPVLNVTIGGGQ